MDVQAALRDGYSKQEVMAELGRRTGMKYQQALKDGHSEDDVISEMVKRTSSTPSNDPADYPQGKSAAEAERMRKEFLRKEKGNKSLVEQLPESVQDAIPSRQQVGRFVRPILEGGGAVVGGILGAPAGPAGSVGGAALGYGIGSAASDLVEGTNPATIGEGTTRSLSNLAKGATFEMGGQLAGKGIGYAADKGRQALSSLRRATPAVTEKGLQVKAGQIIEENTGASPVYESNAAESAKLNIPGYKPSLGEARNDPGLIKLQRGIERQPGTAANTILEQKAANQTAVRDYLDNEFTGNESIDDVINSLSQKKAQIEAASQQAQGAAAAARGALTPADAQTVGRGVVEEITTAGAPAKKAVNEAYQALPNTPQPTTAISQELKALKKEFRPGDEDVYPSRAIARIEEALQGPKPSTGGHGKPAEPVILDAQGLPLRGSIDTTKAEVGFQDLHSLRKDIGRQIQDARTGANPNRELAMKLERLKNAIDSDIEAGMGADNAYTAARDAFTDYARRFRSGEVAKITQRGNQATGLNLPDAAIASRVFRPDGADDFIRAVGKENASSWADQHAANDLLSRANPLTGELDAKAVAGWISKNASTLNKYGLTAKYNTIAKAQAAAEAAKAAESEFTKTAASKILGSDVDKALGAAFSTNPKNTAAVVNDLLKQIGNDKQGIKGLQNAFKDFIITKAETTAKTITGENIISPAAVQKELAKYAPAMRVLYKNEPAKIAALNKVSKAVEIQSRSARSPLGGGSDTAENLNMARSILSRAVDLVPGANMVTRWGKIGLEKLGEMNAAELNKVIARALYDPEFALTLKMASRRYKPELVRRRLDYHLGSMGLALTSDSQEQ